MFVLLKTWIRVGVEHVLVERFGVQVLIDEIWGVTKTSCKSVAINFTITTECMHLL